LTAELRGDRLGVQSPLIPSLDGRERANSFGWKAAQEDSRYQQEQIRLPSQRQPPAGMSGRFKMVEFRFEIIQVLIVNGSDIWAVCTAGR
jgi:hypothetical protein